MEMKNKAKGKKIFPSEERNEDYNSILKLLPLSIFTLIISVLSLKEREVVAYMLHHINFCSDHAPLQRLKSHNNNNNNNNNNNKKSIHNKSTPMFDCHCFDCYHSYWGVWHNSPNHHLIDKAIEAFEDNLTKADNHKFNRNLNRKKAKSVRRVAHVVKPLKEEEEIQVDDVVVVVAVAVVTEKKKEEKDDVAPVCGGGHFRKGLMRKLLPDVWGLFHSRWWNLWAPNI